LLHFILLHDLIQTSPSFPTLVLTFSSLSRPRLTTTNKMQSSNFQASKLFFSLYSSIDFDILPSRVSHSPLRSANLPLHPGKPPFPGGSENYSQSIFISPTVLGRIYLSPEPHCSRAFVLTHKRLRRWDVCVVGHRPGRRFLAPRRHPRLDGPLATATAKPGRTGICQIYGAESQAALCLGCRDEPGNTIATAQIAFDIL